MNPFDALAQFAFDKIKEGIWAQWLKFLFELAFSAVVSFLFACGSFLLAQRTVGVSVGWGMLWSAMALTYLFRRETSRLTKGMIVALPSDEAAKELAADFQTIQKPNQEKKQ